MLRRSSTLIKPAKQRSRWWWVVELLIILLIVLGIRVWNQAELITGAAPNVKAEMTSGERVELIDYRGEPLLLYFWYPDCTMCQFQQSTISDLAKNHSVLTVVQASHQEQLRAYMEEKGISSWPTIMDEEGNIHRQFAVKATPTYYIIDGEGMIRFREVGLSTSWGLRLRLWFAGEHMSDESL
ncbi:redoxin domain-containing protein [Thiofilum flexile]|uniref:redoxin domain-containing protein n=1 Tax=Thiofilum flexile TaxID=125627 RepID=UPI0003604CD0|nr:redoxin domain-containing protein [Thiofilum flexile]